MPSHILNYNCGAYVIGGWSRSKPSEYSIAEAEKEVETIVQQVKAGWTKLVIATLLKEQEPFRKILRKHGFKKTPEAKSKYRKDNTQCIYYFDANCLKQKKAKKK